MARTFTLAQLRTAFRRRGEYDNSATMTDAIVAELLNSAIAEVHNMLVSKGEDYHLTDTTVATVAGTDYVAAPSDFFKLAGLDLEVSSTDKSMLWSMSLDDRLRGISQRGRPERYRLRGVGSSARIVLAPIPDAVYTLRIHYYPVATVLAADGDIYDGINGFEEAVLQLALYRADEREGRPSANGRLGEAQRLLAMFSQAADSRILAEPQYLNPPGGWVDY